MDGDGHEWGDIADDGVSPWAPEDRRDVDGVAVWARERQGEPGVVDVELVEAPAVGPAGMTTGRTPRGPRTPDEMDRIVRDSVAYLTSQHDCDD